MNEERAGQDREDVESQSTGAYPEPPKPYESSPVEPPSHRHEEPGTGTPETDPDYEPQSVRSAARLAKMREEQPIGDAYPEPPAAYDGPGETEGAGTGESVGAAAAEERRPEQREPGGKGGTAPGSRAGLVIGLIALLVVLSSAAWFVVHQRAGGSVMRGGALQPTPGGLVYENAEQHIRFTAPATWTRYDSHDAQVMVRGQGCSFGLLQQRTAVTPERLAADEAAELRRRHPEAQPVVRTRSFSGREAQTFTGSYADSAGQPMTQTYLLVPREGELITLIETSTAQACEPAFVGIEEGMSL